MILYILNLIDLVSTLCALSHGAVELNPLMQCVPIMIIYKVVVVGALVRWMSERSEPIARYGLWVITAVYGAVVLWHIFNLTFIYGGAFP